MAKPTDKPKKSRKMQSDIIQSEYVPAPNTKDIAAGKLKKLGLNVKNDSGVLIAYYKKTTDYETTCERMEEAIKQIGYEGSYGVRFATGAVEFSETGNEK